MFPCSVIFFGRKEELRSSVLRAKVTVFIILHAPGEFVEHPTISSGGQNEVERLDMFPDISPSM